METIIAFCMGIGLSAACGFRVFVPLLFLSVLSTYGWVTLGESFQWISTPTAIAGFSVATALEVGAYYVPWVDNILDTITSPAAVIAGTIASASVFVDMDPSLKWSLAIIAGGGSAGLTQGATVVSRALSSASSGGLLNPIVSTTEGFFSIVFSVFAVFFPFAALVGFIAVCVFLGLKLKDYRKKKSIELAPTPET